MKVTVEHLPQRQVVLNIEADPEDLEKSKQLAYRHLVHRAKVPGFRQGKAPMVMLERYAGKAVFLEEAIQHLVPEATGRAIEEQGIEAAGQPDIEILDTEPVTWKATVDLAPQVDLKDYTEIRIPPDPVKVSRKEADSALEELRFSQAPWEPAPRKSRLGDLLTIDVHGEVGGEQVVDDKGVQYRLVEGSPAPVPGFAEQLVGLGGGETKEFSLAFPEGSEHQEHAGKEYRFTVALNDVKEKILPELDDEFAKGVGEGFDSLKALREQVTTQIRERAEAEARSSLRDKALQAVTDGAEVLYSPGLVLHEAEHMVQEQEDRLKRNRLSMEEYLGNVGKSREELVEEMKPAAQERVVRSLVVTELREQENVEVTDQELEEEMDALVTGAAEGGEGIRLLFQSDEGRQSLGRSLLTRKTLDRLVEIVSQKAGAPAPKPRRRKSREPA